MQAVLLRQLLLDLLTVLIPVYYNPVFHRLCQEQSALCIVTSQLSFDLIILLRICRTYHIRQTPLHPWIRNIKAHQAIHNLRKGLLKKYTFIPTVPF